MFAECSRPVSKTVFLDNKSGKWSIIKVKGVVKDKSSGPVWKQFSIKTVKVKSL